MYFITKKNRGKKRKSLKKRATLRSVENVLYNENSGCIPDLEWTRMQDAGASETATQLQVPLQI